MPNTHSLKTSTNNAVSLPDVAAFKIAGSFTAECWFRSPSQPASSCYLFQSGSYSGNYSGFLFWFSGASNDLNFDIARNTGTTVNVDYKRVTYTNAALHNGFWHHLVAKFDGSYMYIYLDGVEVLKTSWTYAPGYHATNYVRIGCGSDTGTNHSWFPGDIDEVRFFNVARTPAQIRAGMYSEIASDTTGLVGCWRLNNDYNDACTGANHGSAIGSPSFRTIVPFVAPVTTQELNDIPAMLNDTRLVSYYRGEDVVDSKGTNDLTNNNTVAFNASKFGNGFDLGASNSNKYLIKTANYGIAGNGAATFAFWIKLQTEIGSGSYILFEHTSQTTANRYMTVYYDYNSGTRRLRVDWSAGTAGTANVTLGTTDYHHIAIARTASAVYIYLDGVLVSAAGTLGTDTYAFDYLSIGSGRTGNSPSSAIIDDFQVWNATLNAYEIATLFNNPSSGSNARALKLRAAASQGLVVTDAAVLKPTGNFTVEAWYRCNDTADDSVIFQSYSVNTNQAGIRFVVMAAGIVRILSGRNTGTGKGTDYEYVDSTANVKDGNWHHLAFVYNGSTLTCYIDAKQDGQISWTYGAGYAATNYVRIGCNNVSGTNQWFTSMELDEIRFLSVARTQAQIASDMETKFDGSEANTLGYWDFEGQFADRSSNAHETTPIGGANFTLDVPVWIKANYNPMALSLSESATQKLVLPNVTALKPTGAFTFECWIKTSSAGWHNIFESYNYAGGVAAGFLVGIAGSNTVRFLIANNTGWELGVTYQKINSATNVCDGAWHHIAAVNDGSYIRIYIDGVEDNTAVAWANNAAYQATTYVRIGCENDNGSEDSWFNGLIDDVRLWSVARTAEQINANKATEIDPTTSGLVFYQKYNAGLRDQTTNYSLTTAVGNPVIVTTTPFSSLNQAFTSTLTDAVKAGNTRLFAATRIITANIKVGNPAITAQRIMVKLLTDAVKVSGSAFKRFSKTINSATLKIGNTRLFKPLKTFTASLVLVDPLIGQVKLLAKLFTEQIKFGEVFARGLVVARTFTANIKYIAFESFQFNKILSANLKVTNPLIVFSSAFSRTFTEGLSIVDTFIKALSRTARALFTSKDVEETLWSSPSPDDPGEYRE